MESKWRQDSQMIGMTNNGLKLSTVLSLGFFWMRPAGCHTVYRGQDTTIDGDRIVAVMDIDDREVEIANQNLPASTIWSYVRRQVTHCGIESEDSLRCRIVIDDNGDMIAAVPNKPSQLEIKGLSGGKFRLRWRYLTEAEEVAVSSFNIYVDSGGGFDFETPAANVTVPIGVLAYGVFSWTSGKYTHGNTYKFCVRSVSATGDQTDNTNFVSGVADSVGPDAATGISAAYEVIDG